MNLDIHKLHNIYFVMRHGKSQANHEELIISTPERGVDGYGLTQEGEQQARASAQNRKSEDILDESTIFVSSDFSRAKETAEIAAEVLGANPPVITALLRERNFGHYEGTHNSNYKKAWEVDARNASHDDTGVEEVADVRARALSLLESLEEKYQGKNIVLVSHGDTLQILLTAFAEVEPHTHRELAHLQTAEIRRCN